MALGPRVKFWKFYCRIKILQFLLRIPFHPVMLKLQPENAGRMGETGAALKLRANGAAVSADRKDMTSLEADCAAASVKAKSCPGDGREASVWVVAHIRHVREKEEEKIS
ncbi:MULTISPECIES: hypothetical protein [Rhizobium/Agrobacterium group]|nr:MULTISPECIES: hypothetical protein [Rhizobium/Agrobacterium group]MBB4401824.1 hypothetical protein [Agrobacterium radiobacter]MBB5587570.1 hypothetical protein [Agrobacterium radiobacter]NTB96094.1 hypothetical protein [Agrobacterium tumefaciens]NTC46619.1 hypothetical protein [Agrobacterium tumefaciens]RVT80993.1 hypothetical protein EM858_01590 [Agrobacterium sp. CNPSo 2736]